MKIVITSSFLVVCSQAAVVFSEFEPNPAGGDPSDSTFELAGGVPSASFDYYIVSLENDGFNGRIDRSARVTGTFDVAGLASVTTPDLENPTFTALLVDIGGGDSADFSIGDDLDAADDGNLILPTSWTILDAVGVSDEVDDDSVLYGETLGGSNILHNGEFEPLLVFRDGSTGDWYQTVTIDFGSPEERVGAYAATPAGELTAANFGGSLAPTYGTVNPTFVPEPSTALLGGIALLGLFRRRR